MRNANGYGSIVKLKKRLRRPYMVRGAGIRTYDPDRDEYYYKRPIIGYYATQAEARSALAEYNESPFDLTQKDVTFGDIWDIYRKSNYPKLSKRSIDTKNAAYKYCEPIENIPIRKITTAALREVIDNCPHGSSTKSNIKTIMHSVFHYACENNLTSKDYSDFIQIETSDPVFERVPFTPDEVSALWDRSGDWDVQVILILLYTGMRVNELLKNTAANVDVDAWTVFVPKELSKNKQSTRLIPIHEKIRPFFSEFLARSVGGWLICNDNGSHIAYNNFVSRNLPRINKAVGCNHRFHDTRHSFISQCTECGIDSLYIKRIVGHVSQDVTRDVYTHVQIERLHEELRKFHY